MTGVITSLPPLVEQPPGSNASNPAGLPGLTYIAAIPILPQTWTGLQTFTDGSVEFAGSTSGNTFLNATAIASGVLTLPAATDTLVGRNTTDTLTNKTLTSPVFVTPNLGVATATSINKYTFTAPATAATLTILDGKTATFNNTITFAGTDGTTLTFQGTGTYIGRATTDTLTNKTFDTAGTGNALSIAGVAVTANNGTGAIVRTTSPVLVTPALGTPASGVATNLTGTASGLTAGNVTTNANLTGDVTSVGNASTIAANAVSNSKLATMAAFTFKGNNTSGSAAPTDVDIHALTLKASPAGTDEVIISDQAASGAWKRAPVSSLASASGVSSIAGNTGAFTLSTGITNSTNDIRLDTGNLPGVATNSNAAAGKLGEYIESIVLLGSAVTLANSTAKDITFISLTAGDWDVTGNAWINTTGTISLAASWVSSTSATLPTPPAGGMNQQRPGASALISNAVAGPVRFSLAGTTSVFISTFVTFTTGATAYGIISARRVR